MKEILISIFIAIQAFLGINNPQEFGATILRAPQGGTGLGTATAGDVGKYLKVSDDSPFTYVFDSPSGSGDITGGASLGTGINIFDSENTGILRFNSIAAGSNITLSTTTNNNTIVISSTASGSGGTGNVSTSTNETAGRLAYFTSNSATPALLGEVSTTTLTASSPLSLSNPVAKVGGSNSVLTISTTTTSLFSGLGGQILAYNDGLGYLPIATSSINVGTATALAANGSNCSAGNAPLGVDASGAVESCFDVWTEAENTSAGYIGLSSLSATWPIVYNNGTGAFTFTGLSTTTNSGLSQGFVYVGSGGLFQTVSTSTALASKQDVLVSGTNIKTINGSSILGSGDLTVTGSGSGLASSTPWTFGSLVVAKDNGSVTTISTSTIGTSQLTNDANFVDGTGVTNALVGFVDSNTVQATGTTHSLYVPSIFASTTNLNTFKGDIEVGTENGSPYLETAGADASPPFSFRGDTDTGMWRQGVNTLGFATGGTNRLTISSTGNLTFGYSSSTAYSSFAHASTTNFTFGGVTADTWPEFCTTITGSADLCDGSDASGAGGSSAYEIATTSDIAVPQVAYFTQTGGRTTLGSIATGTISVPTGLTITANRYALGGSAAIGLDTGYVIPLQSTLDGKEDDLTFNWPLTRSTNTISWGGLSTTTNLTVGHIPFVSGANTFSSRATTSASCAGSVSCTGFDILGSSPITITGTDSTASTTLLGDTNSWTGVNRFSLASTTYHSFGTASTTNLNIGGDTFIDLTGTGLAVSGGVLNTSNIPNASLANSTISGISLGSNLADLTATNGTLTFSGTYNGGTARTIGLNLANANVWTAKQDFFGAASSTLLSANQAWFGGTATTSISNTGLLSGPYSSSTIYSSFQTSSTTEATISSLNILDILKLPSATSPTLGIAGRFGLDTTSNNLILSTSTSGHIVVASATTSLYAFTATTSPIVSGGTMDLPSHPLQQVMTKVWCKVSGGTSLQIFFSDGTNDTNTITCTTTGTEYAITSNNTWTAYEAIRIEYGTKTGDTGDLSLRAMGYRVSN